MLPNAHEGKNHQQTTWIHSLPTCPNSSPTQTNQPIHNQPPSSHLFFVESASVARVGGTVKSRLVIAFFFGVRGLPWSTAACSPEWRFGPPSKVTAFLLGSSTSEVPKIEEKQCLEWRAGRLSNRGVSTSKKKILRS